jgi:2-amino-4-hydroxy-6-hydroxymethyldihydropteridine diphosphokinase
VKNFRVSSFYDTTPVSPIPQPNFLNCTCAFETRLSPETLLGALQEIETKLGKRPKKKNEPRPIDIDILLFGERFIDTPTLQVPHPALLERLFVLRPLSDLTETIRVSQREGPPLQIHLREFLRTFANPHQETVAPLATERGISIFCTLR